MTILFPENNDEFSQDSVNYTPDSTRNALNFEDSNSVTPTLPQMPEQENSSDANIATSQFLAGKFFTHLKGNIQAVWPVCANL